MSELIVGSRSDVHGPALHPLLQPQIKALRGRSGWRVLGARASDRPHAERWADVLDVATVGDDVEVTVLFQAFRPVALPDIVLSRVLPDAQASAVRKALKEWNLDDPRSLLRLLNATRPATRSVSPVHVLESQGSQPRVGPQSRPHDQPTSSHPIPQQSHEQLVQGLEQHRRQLRSAAQASRDADQHRSTNHHRGLHDEVASHGPAPQMRHEHAREPLEQPRVSQRPRSNDETMPVAQRQPGARPPQSIRDTLQQFDPGRSNDQRFLDSQPRGRAQLQASRDQVVRVSAIEHQNWTLLQRHQDQSGSDPHQEQLVRQLQGPRDAATRNVHEAQAMHLGQSRETQAQTAKDDAVPEVVPDTRSHHQQTSCDRSVSDSLPDQIQDPCPDVSVVEVATQDGEARFPLKRARKRVFTEIEVPAHSKCVTIFAPLNSVKAVEPKAAASDAPPSRLARKKLIKGRGAIEEALQVPRGKKPEV